MSNAVLTSDTASVASILEKTTTLMTINAWIRDYPELMYVGLYLNNLYADWGSLRKWGLSYAQQKQLSFKNIGSLDSTMTVNQNEVVWYEAGLYTEEAAITTANAAPAYDVIIPAKDIAFFKVNDIVAIKPKVGSTTAEVQAKITAVNTSTNTITLDTQVGML